MMGKIKVKIKKIDTIQEKDQKELDAVYPGFEDLQKLSRGVTECIHCGSPLEEKKKKQAGPGNPLHSADGKFGTKSNNTSWSLSNPNKLPGTWGQSSMTPGSNQRKITKKDPKTKRCGRDKADGHSKSKYKCKGGAVWEHLQEDQEERVSLDRKAFDLLMRRVTDGYDQHLQSLEEDADPQAAKVKAVCGRYGLKTFRNFIEAINTYQLAADGKLHQPKKEK